MINGHSKTIQELIVELRDELREFLTTRLAMLRAEMNEKVRTIRMAAPVAMVGMVLLLTAWFTFTGFLIAIIAQLVPGAWAFVIAFAVVTVLYGLAGVAFASYAFNKLKRMKVKPERTIHVLEQDRIWRQTEARTQV